VPEGETGTVYTSRSLLLTGTLSGAGTLVLVNQAVTGNVQLAGLADTFEGTVRLVPAATNPILQALFAYGQFRGLPLAALDLGATNTLQPVTMASGNTFPIGALTGASSAVLGGAVRGGAITYTIGALGRDDWFAGAVQAHAHLTKSGTGTLTLAGTAAHTGATTVAAGTLSLLGTCTVSRVTVATNAELAGVGRIGGGLAVASNAVLRPGGGGVGTLTVSNGLSANAARWQFDLSASPTNGNDRFVLQGGVLALSNAQALAFQLSGGARWARAPTRWSQAARAR
jgi:autotransporter-associated beta strand protein